MNSTHLTLTPKESISYQNMAYRFVYEHKRLLTEGSNFATAIQQGSELKDDDMAVFVKDLAGHIGLMIQLRRSTVENNAFGFAVKECIESVFPLIRGNSSERHGLDQAFQELKSKIFGNGATINWAKGLDAVRAKASELINPDTISAYINKVFVPAEDDIWHQNYARLFVGATDRPNFAEGAAPVADNRILTGYKDIVGKPVEAVSLAEEVRQIITQISSPTHLAGVEKGDAKPIKVEAVPAFTKPG